MQFKILETKRLLLLFFLLLFFINCSKKNDGTNQVSVTVHIVDKESKQQRINQFDTVIVRKQGIGYLVKTYDLVGKYAIDSTGSMKIKIDTLQTYNISVSGLNVLGGRIYYPGELKEGDEIKIEVFSVQDR